MTDQEERIIDLLVAFAPREIRRDYPQPDVCILSTAVAVDVLDHFGINARPLSVITIVGNKAFADQVAAGGFDGIGDDWWQSSGAHSVGLGVPEEGRSGRKIHLVAVTATRLIDLSLGQASRPDRGITAHPLAFPLLVRDDGIIAGGRHVDGTEVYYRSKPGDTSFRGVPDWANRKKRAAIVGSTIRQIANKLRAKA